MAGDSRLEQLAKTDRNPVEESEYQNLLTSSGIPFTNSGGRASIEGFGTGGNATDTGMFQYAGANAQQQQIFQNAIRPAVSSLEASRPEVTQSFDTRAAQVEAGREPLKARYDKLIADIRGAGASQETDTTRVLRQELGKRGITGSSTFAQEEELRRIQPIQQATESNVTNTTLDREEKLRGLDDVITNLTQEKVAALRDITNSIAQIQASAGTDAAKQALEMYRIRRDEIQKELDRAVAEKNAETARITATTANYGNYKEVQGGLYDVVNNRWVVAPKPTGTSGITIPTIPTVPTTTDKGFDYNTKPNLNTTTTPSNVPPQVQKYIQEQNAIKSTKGLTLGGLNLGLNAGQAKY